MKKKRLLSIVLSLCMVLALMPQMVFAEGETSGTPSVSAYATKGQLKGDTFAPDSDGNAKNIGKLVFGKSSSRDAQEWYLLGTDNGVTGDNTIIFAASPIATKQVFSSITSDRTYSYGAGTGYGDTAGSKTVYANHYGASDLRTALQGMESSNFTTAEQSLMNTSTVTTNDTNNATNYTTTDKLYALAADGEGSSYKTIKAGSDNNTVLAMNSYWSSGDRFWLRSPHSDKQAVLCANPGNYVEGYGVSWSYGDGEAVQPASNLNLSSVLFASAATAASSDIKSGTIADGTAMTLRLDGSSKNIGAITYRTATGDIFATKGSTTGDVALVVQGKDGDKDWYYSKQITGTETEIVNVSDIKSELGLSSNIDLLTAKIWLETTDAADGMIYAVDPIRSDKLEKITPPDSIAVENGTAYEDMNLPETVNVKTAGNSVTKLPVVWDKDNPKEGSYDPSIKTEQTVTLYGTLQLPDAIEGKNPDVPATTTITITIKAAPGTLDNSNKDNDSKIDDTDDSNKDNDSNKDKESKTVAKESVKTGDNTSLALWIVLMLLSGAGIIGVTLYTRRKRTNG